MQGALSVDRMCGLTGVSRAGFYRWLAEGEPDFEEMEMRATIQTIAMEHNRRYGYRRITAELRLRGMVVNHKRVARLMRVDNLLAVRRRAFLSTTDSAHDLEVYFNLAARMRLTGINQLWVADLTFIRLQNEFVYLALILDAFSRKVVGWALGRSLSARLPTAALRMAIADRKPEPGLVHHSDRGAQYASDEYGRLLEQHGIIPSMSRPGNPYDNARCESFIKTLKYEEIYASEYQTLEHLQANLEMFIEGYYNRRRLHSALGYRSPEAFEHSLPPTAAQLQATMRFSRHEEIYRPMWDSVPQGLGASIAAAPTHRLDEFPAGYSSASCTPAELASASPTVDHSGGDK